MTSLGTNFVIEQIMLSLTNLDIKALIIEFD